MRKLCPFCADESLRSVPVEEWMRDSGGQMIYKCPRCERPVGQPLTPDDR